ncbi:MAG: pirin family protein ['Candidatus Kapabacteria' thiocyanatum]|uniref:Pirin n=1 Tax=Candidatus Kapaibacterium thiocyanatum TaxID=1895771 RepID=A0A1M3KWY2_9BACT|nr:pirin family protein ['Candidatus Kapabacteria' thiocyanatum]OJX56922.1 MAG: hypothetical protein BGO89_10385 ['Candidatus Kapabacteria' thiocyanatum]
MATKRRGVRTVVYAPEFPMGPMRVKQPLPSQTLDQVSPFVLLHHASPQKYEQGATAHRIEPHPHRGFEPVTFVFQGEVYHRDSRGNEGIVGAGEVQWMTAGSGILHSEGPSPRFVERGGTLELVQLWINLPRAYKMMEPKYQDIHRGDIPVVMLADGAARAHVVAGSLGDVTGPATTSTPINAIMLYMDAGASFELDFGSHTSAMLYLLKGSINVNGSHDVGEHYLTVFDETTGVVTVTAREAGYALVLSGEPIDEPVVASGPFVMNSQDEIRAAWRDFVAGKMGQLVD